MTTEFSKKLQTKAEARFYSASEFAELLNIAHEQREVLRNLRDAAIRDLLECSLESTEALHSAAVAAAPFLQED